MKRKKAKTDQLASNMQTSFFDLDNRYPSLSKGGDTLEHLNAVIDWELFRPVLDLVDDKKRKNTAGRKPTDRCSFARFLGVMLDAKVPDARTVWAFRDALKEKE